MGIKSICVYIIPFLFLGLNKSPFLTKDYAELTSPKANKPALPTETFETAEECIQSVKERKEAPFILTPEAHMSSEKLNCNFSKLYLNIKRSVGSTKEKVLGFVRPAKPSKVSLAPSHSSINLTHPLCNPTLLPPLDFESSVSPETTLDTVETSVDVQVSLHKPSVAFLKLPTTPHSSPPLKSITNGTSRLPKTKQAKPFQAVATIDRIESPLTIPVTVRIEPDTSASTVNRITSPLVKTLRLSKFSQLKQKLKSVKRVDSALFRRMSKESLVSKQSIISKNSVQEVQNKEMVITNTVDRNLVMNAEDDDVFGCRPKINLLDKTLIGVNNACAIDRCQLSNQVKVANAAALSNATLIEPIVEADVARTGNDSDELDRRDWELIRAIPSDAFRRLLLVTAISKNIKKKLTFNSTRVIRRIEGTYHHVVFLLLNNCGAIEEYVIKVPAHGTKARWTKEDKDVMRYEAELLKYIRYNTQGVPVPKVIGYSPGIDSEIGHPFIVMKKLPGKSADNIWFGKPFDTDADDEFLEADCPSEETRAKRITFLRSLAYYMAELSKLEFNAIGMPNLVDWKDKSGVPIAVGPSYHWHSEELETINAATLRGPFHSTREYIMSALNNNWAIEEGDQEDFNDVSVFRRNLGTRKVLDIIYSTPAFMLSKAHASDEHESFVICHNDLDFQNILTDEQGNVTGILDRDNCFSAPRCVGYAAVPKFLCRDWFPNHNMSQSPYMGWMMESYRQIYAALMVETGVSGAQYTTKSAMYGAAIGALYEGGDAFDLIRKVLQSVPGMTFTKLEDFTLRLGIGWRAAEEYLKVEIPKLFTPQFPGHSSLPALP